MRNTDKSPSSQPAVTPEMEEVVAATQSLSTNQSPDEPKVSKDKIAEGSAAAATTTASSSSQEAVTHQNPESAKEKLEHVWTHVSKKGGEVKSSLPSDPPSWPSYNDVFKDIRKSDYGEMLTCPMDIQTSRKRPKQICAQGIVCCAKLELFGFPNQTGKFKGRPYSGLLSPGTTAEHCLLRFSSALQPMNTETKNGKKRSNGNRTMAKMMFGQKLADAKLFPAVAMKLFRSTPERESSNILFLGCKVGQTEDDFFAHCLCTQLTSRMPATLKPILRIFQKYSQYPLALGLSSLCLYDKDGTMCDDLNFPFCLTLKPCYQKWQNDQDNDGDDDDDDHDDHDNEEGTPGTSCFSFLGDIRKIPVGTVLYDLYASPTPLSVADPTKLQRIGRIVSTSEMANSVPDDKLFFRHQKKDEDFQLRPHWIDDLSTPVVLRDGTKGTSQTLAGWELFEDQIKTGDYVDFESPSKTPSLL